MAIFADLSPEERLGLGVAVALHVGLGAALLLKDQSAEPYTPPERIDVSLANEISMESTAPDPSANPAAAIAPEIDEVSQPEELPEEPREVVEEPVRQPVVQPRPPVERPRAAPTPTPRPTARATQRPAPTPTPTPASRQQATGSRIGSDFMQGLSDADGDSGAPAATFGQAERAALAQAITRQLRPHWTAPSGLDVELLVTVVAFDLNRDGTLKNRPRCIEQRGDNASNRAQLSLHCERAIRAVQLAAPFNLPEQFYSRWDELEWEFDRRL